MQRPSDFFREKLRLWHQDVNQRSLPWKGEKDPYKIWLSEIILQQTRAEQGLPYYVRFTEAYPTVHDLARAKDDEVFKLWEGLGYYARCRNMLAAARYISGELNGRFPDTYEGIRALKGIGPYTAAAIASFAFGLPYAVVDGNVYRVLARFFGITTPTDGTEGKKLFQALADEVLDHNNPGPFNQAMMDLGAVVCTPAAPDCESCPLNKACVARRDGLVALLPVRAKKIAVRQRFFHYLLLFFDGKIWIRKRSGRDVWNGLYEPYLVEAEQALDSRALFAGSALPLSDIETQAFEGELTQRLTHQLIHSRFFSVTLKKLPELPADGIWVSLDTIRTYAFPRSLVTFFEKKGYF